MKTWQCALFSAAFHGLVFYIQPAVPQIPKEPDKEIIKLLVLEKPALNCEAQAASAPIEKTAQLEAAKEPAPPPLVPPEPVEEIKQPEPEPPPKPVEIVKKPEPKPVKKIELPKKRQVKPKKKPQQIVKEEKVKPPEKKEIPPKAIEKIAEPVVEPKILTSPNRTVQASAFSNSGNLSTINSKGISNTSGTEVKADKIPNPPAPVVTEFGALGGPKFSRRVMPKYPKAAQRLGVEGEVTLKLSIDASGKLTKVEVVKGAGRGFDEEAVQAVRHSKFRPAQHNGSPVSCVALIKIQFKLNSGA